MEKVILKIRRHFIVLYNVLELFPILKRTFEKIERTVILVAKHIFHVLPKWQSQLKAIIVLTHFKL